MGFKRIEKDVKPHGQDPDLTITVTIDRSLRDHVEENLARRDPALGAGDAIAGLLAMILNDSAYPIEARRTGDREIRLAYHLRSFSQPIF